MEAYSLQEHFAHLPIGMYRATPGATGIFLDANPAFSRILGLPSVAELLRYEPATFYRHPEQRTALSRTLLEHGHVQQELELLTLDARRIRASVHIQCREIVGHGPVFEGTVEDITARREEEAAAQPRHQGLEADFNRDIPKLQAAQQLTEQEAFFQDLVDHHPGFIGRCLPDTTVVFANTTLTQFWGGSPIGIRWIDLLSTEKQAELRDYLQRFTPEAPLGTYEHQLSRTDGAVRTIQWTVRAFFDGTGELTHFQAVGLDVTEQREAEEALRKSERRFRQMAESIEEVFLLRAGDELLYISPACERILGHPPEAFYPSLTNLHAMLLPEDRERVRASLQEANASGAPSEVIVRMVRPDGEMRWLHGHSYTLYDEYDGTSLRAGTLRDITAYKTLQHQLEAASRAKSDFLSAVSHDLRTPLNVLIGFTELLAESPLDGEQRHHLSLCQSAGQRLLGLIDTLLELSRLESGHLVAEQQPMELRTFLDEQLGLLLPQAQDKGLVLDWSVDAALPTYVKTDPNRLAQVLFNLVGNAIAYTEVGSVEVTVRRDGLERARVVVRDTGPGIPAALQERIFEPFERGEAGTRQHHSGLGLALARDLVRLLGGEIDVDSEPGRGATFTFTLALPATAPPNPEIQPREASDTEPGPPESPGEGLHVLAAEDDTTNVLLLHSLFERAQCVVEVVTDGEEVLTVWERMRPDLVVLDLDMPGMDGYQILGALRARESFCQCGPIPIVALTAHAHEETRMACYAVGYDTYLSKPVTWQSIQRLVAWVQRSRAL